MNATYSNGQTIAIYKLAVATFADPNGIGRAQRRHVFVDLEFRQSRRCRRRAATAPAPIFGSELESSTTDTSGQFSNMISAQQAYSAASQVITTVNKMFDTLISAMR